MTSQKIFLLVIALLAFNFIVMGQCLQYDIKYWTGKEVSLPICGTAALLGGPLTEILIPATVTTYIIDVNDNSD